MGSDSGLQLEVFGAGAAPESGIAGSRAGGLGIEVLGFLFRGRPNTQQTKTLAFSKPSEEP